MKYCKIVNQKGRKLQGYINAVALGWDSEVWRFSLKTDDKKLAQNRLKELFNVMKSDLTLNHKTELDKIVYNGQPKKKTKKPTVIKDSLKNIMAEYVKNFEIEDCLECEKTRKPFQMNYKQKFCRDCKHLRNKNQWSTQKSREKKLNEFFKDVRIKDFNFDLAKRYILEMKRCLSDDSIINYLDFLKSALNLHYDNHDAPVPFNVRKFLRYKKHLSGRYKLKKRERTDDFTREKLDLILMWLTNEQTKLILETMFYVPSRISEYMKMRKTQFEYPALTIESLKDGETRVITLSKELADRYQEMINNSETDFIFNTSYRAVYGQFTRAIKTLNLNLVIHQLRIRAATQCFDKDENGNEKFNTKQVQALGGWKTEAMVFRYYKLSKDRLKEDSKKLFN